MKIVGNHRIIFQYFRMVNLPNTIDIPIGAFANLDITNCFPENLMPPILRRNKDKRYIFISCSGAAAICSVRFANSHKIFYLDFP